MDLPTLDDLPDYMVAMLTPEQKAAVIARNAPADLPPELATKTVTYRALSIALAAMTKEFAVVVKELRQRIVALEATKENDHAT